MMHLPGPTAARTVRSRALVYDLRATLHGERRFFIVEIFSAKHAAFLRALDQGEESRLEDFGAVLHRGWDEPDDELKADLHRRFGMYPDIEW
jgi:hypothetical protein